MYAINRLEIDDLLYLLLKISNINCKQAIIPRLKIAINDNNDYLQDLSLVCNWVRYMLRPIKILMSVMTYD